MYSKSNLLVKPTQVVEDSQNLFHLWSDRDAITTPQLDKHCHTADKIRVVIEDMLENDPTL